MSSPLQCGGSFLCLQDALSSLPNVAACCWCLFVWLWHRDHNLLPSALYPQETLHPPKNWLKSQRGYDLESLALWIRFSAKFLGLMEDGSLGVRAVGWVQWGRIPWQGWHPAVPGDKHHRHLPAQTSPCVLNRTLSSETDFFTASELRLTDRIFYPGEGGKPETRYLPVVFLFFDFLCKTLRCLGNGFPCQMEGYGWKTRRTKTFCSLLP